MSTEYDNTTANNENNAGNSPKMREKEASLSRVVPVAYSTSTCRRF
jgi:hypothetical protein